MIGGFMRGWGCIDGCSFSILYVRFYCLYRIRNDLLMRELWVHFRDVTVQGFEAQNYI